MREDERQLNGEQDPEATVISPLFDGDSTQVARPVVPLDDRAVAEDIGAYVETGTAPPAYTRAWKRRTYWTAALVVVSLLVGTVVGIAGLRLYQRGRAADAQAPASEQPAGGAAASSVIEQTPVEASSLPAAAAPEPAATPAAVRDEAVESAARAAEESETRERQTVANDRRPAPEEARAAPVKQGKKGDEEEARDRVEPNPPPAIYDTQGPAPEGSAAARRAAREEERLRRAERQMRRERRRARRDAYMVDSIRGVFEGRRESPPR